jgi:hypothetical protein
MQAKLSLFFLKSSLFLPFLAVIGASEGLIDQNNVITEALDAVPWDIIVLSPAKQSEESAGAKDDEGLGRTLRQTQFNVPYIT